MSLTPFALLVLGLVGVAGIAVALLLPEPRR